jgi:Zn-dependent membrane protease YugP
MDDTDRQIRLAVVVLLLGATVAFTVEFLVELVANGVNLLALGLALVAAALLFERLLGRSSA